MEGLKSPARAHRALGAGGDRSRHIQTLCEPACAAPTASVVLPLRRSRADTPGSLATPGSPSIPCVSTHEYIENAISLNHRYLTAFTNSCGEPLFHTGPYRGFAGDTRHRTVRFPG